MRILAQLLPVARFCRRVRRTRSLLQSCGERLIVHLFPERQVLDLRRMLVRLDDRQEQSKR